MTTWAGKVVAITGAAGGIGSAMARWFTGVGASVALLDSAPDKLRAFGEELRTAGADVSEHAVDISDQQQVAEQFAAISDTWGAVDALINNAAIADDTDLLDTTPQRWDAQHNVVLRGPYLCCQAVIPGMRERGGGVIVNISSVNAAMYVGNEVYSAAKAGLNSLTRSIAVRYGKHGIRCVGIAPGTVRTPIWDHRIKKDPGIVERVSRWYPIGRVGTPEDVAHLAGFVTSDEASWLTGTTIVLDGGVSAGNPLLAADILSESEDL